MYRMKLTGLSRYYVGGFFLSYNLTEQFERKQMVTLLFFSLDTLPILHLGQTEHRFSYTSGKVIYCFELLTTPITKKEKENIFFRMQMLFFFPFISKNI